MPDVEKMIISSVVVLKATVMIIKSTNKANPVIRPDKINMLQIISIVPVKYAQNTGLLKLNLANLPGSSLFGNKYF